MLKVSRPTPSHFGIYVTDLERMVAFYTETFSARKHARGNDGDGEHGTPKMDDHRQ